MAKKRIKVASAKAKGRALQQWVAKQISDLTGFYYGTDQPIESRPMGQSGTDIRLEEQVLKQFPYSVECKAQESWAIHKWIEQAKTNRIPNTTWLLFAKRKRNRPVVILDAEVFFSILNSKRQIIIDKELYTKRILRKAKKLVKEEEKKKRVKKFRRSL